MPKGGHEGHGEPHGGGHGEGHGEGHGDNHEHQPGEHHHEEHGLEIPEHMPPVPDTPKHTPGKPGGGEHVPGEGGPKWVPGDVPKGPRKPNDGPRKKQDAAPPPPAPAHPAGPAELPRNPILEVFHNAQEQALKDFSGLDDLDLNMARDQADWRRGLDDSKRNWDATNLGSKIDGALGKDAAEGLKGLEWNLREWHREKSEFLKKDGVSNLEERANSLLNETRRVYSEIGSRDGLDENTRTELAIFMVSNWEAINRSLEDAALGNSGLVGNLWDMERAGLSADSRLLDELRTQRSPLDRFGDKVGTLAASLASAGEQGKSTRQTIESEFKKLGNEFKKLSVSQKKLGKHLQEFRNHLAAIDGAANHVRVNDIAGQSEQARTIQRYVEALEGHVAQMLRASVLPAFRN